jgi:2-C-methyl-D-erythritol 4-phosphate cytidylyltransferase
MKASAVIVAGGQSIRFGGETPKQFVRVGGRMLLAWTIDRFEQASSIASIVVVVPADAVDEVRDMVANEKYRKIRSVTAGGGTRSQSVLAGLRLITDADGLVAIHDGARPLVSPSDIDRVVAAAASGDAAILAIPASDAIKKTSEGVIRTTIDRHDLYYAQTPQVFELSVIRRAHEMRGEKSFADDAALVEEQGVRVRVVEPTYPNIKVTRPEDLLLIEHLLTGGNRG